MPRFFLLSFLLFPWFTLFAQNENLIYNGSFEKKVRCPDNFGMFAREQIVFGWDSPSSGTPDYFHSCSEKSGVPNNWAGYSDAFHGEAYMGIIACMQQLDEKQIAYREYLSARLKSPLDSGKVYYASMQIRLGLACNTASNGLGMFFSEVPLQTVRSSNFPVKPQILQPGDPIITEQEEWVKVCGTFEATGNEAHLLIGNFWSNQDMDYKSFDENLIASPNINPIAYYYIDFVEVYEQDSLNTFYCEGIQATIVKSFDGKIPVQGAVTLNSVNFEHDKSTLLPDSYAELNRLAAALHREANVRISINGHTDNTGNSIYNQELSLARANAVRNYLLERGVSRFILEVNGFGNTMPIADNETEEGRKQNRRVEIEVLD